MCGADPHEFSALYSQVHTVEGAVGPADVAAYAFDGVVLLRGIVTADEVCELCDALEIARIAPGPFAGVMGERGGWTDKFLWRS